jgi:hypothetical protein
VPGNGLEILQATQDAGVFLFPCRFTQLLDVTSLSCREQEAHAGQAISYLLDKTYCLLPVKGYYLL